MRALVEFTRAVSMPDESTVMRIDTRDGLCRIVPEPNGVVVLPAVTRETADTASAWKLLVPWGNVAAYLEAG